MEWTDRSSPKWFRRGKLNAAVNFWTGMWTRR